MKEFYSKKRPSKGSSGVHLLHDNASSHKCEVIKSFLASEKVKVLNHPPYSPDPSPCDFFLFPRLKKMLSGNKYTSRSSLRHVVLGLPGPCFPSTCMSQAVFTALLELSKCPYQQSLLSFRMRSIFPVLSCASS